jgi:hypothetical protein
MKSRYAALVVGLLSGVACTPPPEVTFHRDVKPILDQSCVRCHSEGNIAPFALETFEQVASVRELVKVSVENRTMPPWLADPDCETYANDPSLSDVQIETIAKWVDLGGPEGNPADAPSEPNGAQQALDEDFALDRVDVTIDMQDDFVPSGEGTDEYRCYPVRWPEADNKFAVGFGVRPGDNKLVHHVIAYVAPPDRAFQVTQLDAADPRPGYECFGGPGFGGFPRWLGAWAPGGPPVVYPEGTGLRMEPGSVVVLQMHYFTQGNEDRVDRTGIDVKLEDTVEREAFIVPFTNPLWLSENGMSIPAGNNNVRHSFQVQVGEFFDEPFLMYSANAHMHQLGKSEIMWVEDGETGELDCLLDIPRWDFDWQLSYGFEEPKLVTPDDYLGIECAFDNSAPGAIDVEWGEGTLDEMCLGVMYVALP